MMEELSFNWSKRLLVALESIADSAAKIAANKCDCSEVVKPETPVVTIEPPAPDYKTLADEKKRDVLLTLCEDRGIEVKPQTRTTTLAKMLTDYDTAQEVKAATAVQQVPGPEVVDEKGPEPTLPPDPFGPPDADPPTRDDVLRALQKVQQSHDTDAVVGLLRDNAGVETFGALTDDKYAAVLAAAEEL